MLCKFVLCSLWQANLAILLEIDEDFSPLEANYSAVPALDVWSPFSPRRLAVEVLPQQDRLRRSRSLIDHLYKTEYRLLTEWLPQRSPNRLTFETYPITCRIFARCTKPPHPPVKGVGRTFGTSHRVLAFICPFGTAVLIMIGASWNPLAATKVAYGNLFVQSWSAYAALLSSLFFVVLGSDYVTKMLRDVWPPKSTGIPLRVLTDEAPSVTLDDLRWMLSTCYVLTCVCVVATFRFAHVDFERPTLCAGSFLQVVGSVRALVYVLFIQFVSIPYIAIQFYAHQWWWNHVTALWYMDEAFRDFAFFASMGYAGPNIGVIVLLLRVLRVHNYAFFFWGDTTGSAVGRWGPNFFPQSCLGLIFWFLCLFTPYTRDRKFVAAKGFLLTQACRFGQRIDMYTQNGLGYFFFIRVLTMIVLAAICILLMRYQRILPPQLQKARYIRLSYLLKLRNEGRFVTRCQDLPDAAFGDPAKAQHLIVISHRWINRYTCDVPTAAFPGGIRLCTMLRRLEKFFPQSWTAYTISDESARKRISEAMSSALYTSHDVLIFFDFMGLPQRGASANGVIIERTSEEQQLFEEVLPAMGALYTMYPVLVCPEVPDGMGEYGQSGWCFCEYQQATIHNNLLDDGIELNVDEHTQMCVPAFDEGENDLQHADIYLEAFDTALREKKFFYEGDREVVHKIVQGTMIVRMLHQAVAEQDAIKTKAFLSKLTEYGIADAIHYAVDESSLDTVLHIAMRLPSQEMVNLLIDFGADPDRLNMRGDTPREFFMLPAAWVPCLYWIQHIHRGRLKHRASLN